MELNIVGPAYQHYSTATNNQRCINAYITQPGPDGQGRATLVPRIGKKSIVELPDASGIRNIIAVDDILYAVADNKFFKITVNYTTLTASALLLGTIDDFVGIAPMAAGAGQIMIVNNNDNGWIYSPLNYKTVVIGTIGGTASDTYTLTINGVSIVSGLDVSTALPLIDLIDYINDKTSLTNITATSAATGVLGLTGVDDADIIITESGTGFTAGTDGITVSTGPFSSGTGTAFFQISDSNFRGGSSVVFLDGYFFLSVPNSNVFYASQLRDGSRYNSLDVATAEINNSPIIALQVKNRQLWIFKKDYIEVWYDAANATGMPLAPRVGSEISIGCLAPESVVSIDNTLYWFDTRRFVAMALNSDAITTNTTGNVAVPASTDALNNEFSEYSVVSDAVACGYEERGHLMYQITFPTENKTWVYDITTQAWHERNYYDPDFDIYKTDLAEVGIQNQGLLFSGNRTTSDIYVSSPIYFNDDGSQITAKRTSAFLEQDLKLLGIDRVEVLCDSGYATSTGDGADPMISLRYSIDGGHTWSNELPRALGQIGEYNKKPIWNRLGSGFRWVFEFTITAPVKWAIVSASIDVTEIEQY